MKTLTFFATALLAATSAQAAIIPFDLLGTGGPGPHFLSEPAVASGGTGGEIGAGIFFDDVALTLTVNVGWGSSQGFTDLTSNANNSHIHGPTASNFGNNFTQVAGVQTINGVSVLTRSSNLSTGGTITQTVGPLTTQQQTDLFNGKYYVNIHTVTNGGGEIRGFLIPVPEPSTAVLASAGVLGFAARRRRKA